MYPVQVLHKISQLKEINKTTPVTPMPNQRQRKQKTGDALHYRLVHTGQHYDANLSATFFEELGIPEPQVNFEVKSGTQAAQTGAIMVAFEQELQANPTDLVLSQK